jgi:hypothetical protein
MEHEVEIFPCRKNNPPAEFTPLFKKYYPETSVGFSTHVKRSAIVSRTFRGFWSISNKARYEKAMNNFMMYFYSSNS